MNGQAIGGQGGCAPTFPVSAFRWIVLIALLVSEVLWLSLRFDAPAEGALPGGAMAWLIGSADAIARIGIGFAGAFLVLAGKRLAQVFRGFEASPAIRLAAWSAAHFIALAAFAALTAGLFSTNLPQARQLLLVFAWLVSGASVVTAWLFMLATPESWGRLLVRERLTLLYAFCIGVLVWAAGIGVQKLWRPLSDASMSGAYGLLKLVYPDAFQDAAKRLVGTNSFVVEMAPQCSGYEGIALVSAFVATYLWIFRRELRFPHSLALLPLGVVAIWLTNILRIALLIAVGSSLSPRIAAGGFHSQAGWIMFSMVSLGLVALAHRMFFFWRESTPRVTAYGGSGMAAPLIVPLLVFLAATMLVTSVSSEPMDYYLVGVVLALAALLYYRAAYRRLLWDFSWVAVGIGVAVFAMWMLLVPNAAQAALALPAKIREAPVWAQAGWLFFRLVGMVMVVPVIEELAFRGYLLRKLVAKNFENVDPRRFSWLAMLVSSVLFGVMHENWLAGFCAGSAFAVAVYLRGKLADAILAHITANGLIALAAVLN